MRFAHAGVLVVSDVILDVRTGAVAALELGGLSGLVGQDRLEAVPVMVGEGELCAGVGALAAHDHPRALGPTLKVKGRGDLGDLTVGAWDAVLLDRRNPVWLCGLEDLGADRVAQFVADRIADQGLPAPVKELVASVRSRILMPWMCSSGIWSSARSATLIWSAAVFAPAFPGRSSPASASPV